MKKGKIGTKQTKSIDMPSKREHVSRKSRDTENDVESFSKKQSTTLSNAAEGLHEATLFVHRSKIVKGKKEKPEEFAEKKIKVRVFVTTPAQVHVQLGRTIGLANYSSERIEVGITFPCYKEEVKKVVPQLFDYVKKVIQDITE